MTRKMIIDTDTASDDAVAILMALRHPEIHVEAITIVAGNVGVEQASANARYTVELCGREVPVFLGAAQPLVRDPHRAHFFHGEDGMGNMNYPAPRHPVSSGHAVDALIRVVLENPGITIVTLGPMTNLALALKKAPAIVEKAGRVVVMGGAACTVGNITPAAEYNIWCDPEAASICFESGLAIEMVGWELCRGEANLHEDDIRHCREVIDTELSHFAIDCNASAIETNRQWLGEPGIGLPDPIAMAIAIDESICTQRSKHHVAIECEGTLTRGMTVVDQLGVTPHEKKVTVCWEIDVDRWKRLLFKSLGET
ncbi:MAG: nucleoside hydrolase [Acidobacteriota bacterium]